MKNLLTYLLLLSFLLGCQKEQHLTLENVSLKGSHCSDCARVHITMPKAPNTSRIGAALNDAINQEIISLLTFDNEIEANTVNGAIASFNVGYRNLKKLFPEEAVEWEATINAQVSYEDKDRITIEVNSYLFTGGAHGYTSISFMNFDKDKGTKLEDWELFYDTKAFERFAESKFRKQENIPNNTSINSTGFMFEKDTFYLPENIGFTQEGIKLLYNQYEVASFADGPIELTLPYEEVGQYLKERVKS